MTDALISARPLLATLAGVVALLLLIMARRMPAFPALLLAAIFTGLAAGLDAEATFGAIQSGMGGVLGFIAVVVGLGALLGAFLEASGGARALAGGLLAGRSERGARWAMGLVGVVIAIPVFFDVGLILMIPVITALAQRSAQSPLRYGLPLLAGLAAGHAFIPPTPGPVAVADILGAELGWVILFGLLAAIPAVAIAGPVYARWATVGLPTAAGVSEDTDEVAPASRRLAWGAALTILTPLVLIVGGAAIEYTPLAGTPVEALLDLVGHPFSALLIACGLAWLVFKPEDTEAEQRLKSALSRAFEPTAAIILVTGAGGAFKQILVDTGAGAALAEAAVSSAVPPLLAGFGLAALVRVAQGSATVAMLTAAGLVAPIAAQMSLGAAELALLTVAIASGASVVSHVNDSGFWLVSKYFDLTPAQTFRTWTVASTLVGLVGFIVTLALSLVV